jgi:chromosome segregation ATPase
MNPSVIAGIATVIVALVSFVSAKAAAKSATFKAIADAEKTKVDAVKVITDTTLSLLAPLNVEISKLAGRVSTLESEKERLASRIRDLERDNKHLRSENTGLRGRVTVLEKQLLDLGHTPVNGTPSTATVVTHTETKTVTEQQ